MGRNRCVPCRAVRLARERERERRRRDKRRALQISPLVTDVCEIDAWEIEDESLGKKHLSKVPGGTCSLYIAQEVWADEKGDNFLAVLALTSGYP